MLAIDLVLMVPHCVAFFHPSIYSVHAVDVAVVAERGYSISTFNFMSFVHRPWPWASMINDAGVFSYVALDRCCCCLPMAVFVEALMETVATAAAALSA
jgi:hypothetical protein